MLMRKVDGHTVKVQEQYYWRNQEDVGLRAQLKECKVTSEAHQGCYPACNLLRHASWHGVASHRSSLLALVERGLFAERHPLG